MTAEHSHTDDEESTDWPDGGDAEPVAENTTNDRAVTAYADGGSEQPPASDGSTQDHDDRGSGTTGQGEMPTPDEMTLDELREEIRGIDEDLVELIARRTYVADTIAQVKHERGLPTTDETQEQRVMDRAGKNAERFDVDANLVKAIFRLLIELNKVEQRESR